MRCARKDASRCAARSRGTMGDPRGPRNMFQSVAKSLQRQGFRSGHYVGRMDDMRREPGGWLRDGRLKFRAHVFEGLASAPQAIVALLQGETTGKVLVRIRWSSANRPRIPHMAPVTLEVAGWSCRREVTPLSIMSRHLLRMPVAGWSCGVAAVSWS